MPEPIKPPIMAKAALVTGRVLQKPFEQVQKFTDGSAAFGSTSLHVLNSANAAAKEGFEHLGPRGPAKWISGLFGMVESSVTKSAAIGQRNLDVIWNPASKAADEVGHVMANPFAMFYANRAGFELPTDDPATPNNELGDVLGKIVDPEPYTRWPSPAPAEEPPTKEDPPPVTDKPADETPVEKPADETPVEKPADETPVEKPADETPVEKPADETPVEKPADETQTQETPTPTDTPADEPANTPEAHAHG